MPRFKVAHLQERDSLGQMVNLIIIPLESTFGNKTKEDQHSAIAELQEHASAANLAGTVVPVWDDRGRMAFIAPEKWHPYFKSLNLQTVAANINRELFWD